MNIKRAFLAAAAALMVPGFALAQDTITFDTTVEFLPGIEAVDDLVTVVRTCNTGLPLVESLDITEAQGVKFVVEEFDGWASNTCMVEVDMGTVPSPWTVYAVEVNGVFSDTDTACEYDDANGLVPDNTCNFIMAPDDFEWTLNKEWEVNSDEDVAQFAQVYWECDNVLSDIDGTLTLEYGYLGFDPANDSYTVTVLPNPYADEAGEFTTCSASESVFDSAIESDQGCEGPFTIPPGTQSAECTIINTVFFEGIPTLSQYGLAIMALLMLGVGFVGFRRFV